MNTQIPQGTLSCASAPQAFPSVTIHLVDTAGRRYKKKPRIRFLSVFICVHLCLIFSQFSVSAYAQETITVAVASSLYPAMQQKVKAFEKEHHVTVRLVSGSTGRLYNQIVQGAPFDVFIAADKERPALLMHQGKAIAQYEVGHGYLGVMIGKQVVAELSALTNPSIRHIAIANPDVAPFGNAARAVLQKHGRWQALKHKLVYAQNAMQAAMMMDKGLVDAGLIPVSRGALFVATISYVGVSLTDKRQARNFLSNVGSEAQGECCLQQREHPGVLASLKHYKEEGLLK